MIDWFQHKVRSPAACQAPTVPSQTCRRGEKLSHRLSPHENDDDYRYHGDDYYNDDYNDYDDRDRNLCRPKKGNTVAQFMSTKLAGARLAQCS